MTYKTFFGIEHLPKLATASAIAFDTETCQLQPQEGKLRLLQLGSDSLKTIVVIDLWAIEGDAQWEILEDFFESDKYDTLLQHGERHWWAHNAVFDLGWLQQYGIRPKGRVYCTMLASKLLSNGVPKLKHGLAFLAKRYLKQDLSKEQQTSDWSAAELSSEQLEYAAKDVEVLLKLHYKLSKLLTSAGLDLAFALECKALPAMAQMWRTGLPWNRSMLEKLCKDYEHDIARLGKDFLLELDEALPEEHKLPRDLPQRLVDLKDKVTQMGHDDADYEKWYAEIQELETQPVVFNLRPHATGYKRLGTKKPAGFNLNSPKQLLAKFTALLGHEPIDGKTGKASASRAALQNYAADHHVIQTYLDWKKSEKRRQMVDSILGKLDDDGYVRASYLQLGAESGRMSCINPNNQQIPRDEVFRSCVEAPDGWLLVDADFGQMELRLAAAVAKDERMIEAFKNGEDLHTVTAEAIGCSRQIAKSANFGLLYGSGAKGLRNYAGGVGITITKEEATEIRKQWLSTYQGIAKWQRQNAEAADKTQGDWGEIRIPGSNMRRYLPGEMNRLTVRCNTPIQGAGAAILKCALGNLWPELEKAGEDEVRIAACIHDEILLIVKRDKARKWAAKLKDIMETAESKWLGDIPALAEPCIGKRWSEIH